MFTYLKPSACLRNRGSIVCSCSRSQIQSLVSKDNHSALCLLEDLFSGTLVVGTREADLSYHRSHFPIPCVITVISLEKKKGKLQCMQRSLYCNQGELCARIATPHLFLPKFQPLASDCFKFKLDVKWQFDVIVVQDRGNSPIRVYAVVVSHCATIWGEIIFCVFLPLLTKYWSVAFSLTHFNLQMMMLHSCISGHGDMCLGIVISKKRRKAKQKEKEIVCSKQFWISVELVGGQQYSYVCLKYSSGNGIM
ncbi:hypothetical protein VNO77_33714 [Canavalia gladiata]|uniref:Uncharacterized protein n=1 Tax=Canavalia gladiata TaxID=3824 RepID=A0AAN9KDV1_CANGL